MLHKYIKHTHAVTIWCFIACFPLSLSYSWTIKVYISQYCDTNLDWTRLVTTQTHSCTTQNSASAFIFSNMQFTMFLIFDDFSFIKNESYPIIMFCLLFFLLSTKIGLLVSLKPDIKIDKYEEWENKRMKKSRKWKCETS